MNPAIIKRCSIALLILAAAALGAFAYWHTLGGRVLRPGAEVAAPPAGVSAVAHYAGADHCAECHLQETAAWKSSHHALSMQPANAGTVAGDFHDAQFKYGHVTSTLFMHDGRYYARTDGADGKLADFEIRYTFGVAPLQQYLIQTLRGRLQALSIAWDTRPKEQGGQRWFHLYPIGAHAAAITAGDILHWTGRDQNWNFMCSTCHSTGVLKNYDLDKDSFATTWTDIDVACEACHGPGSAHIAWARQSAANDRLKVSSAQTSAESPSNDGLAVATNGDEGGRWQFLEGHPIAQWDGRKPRQQAEMCFPCHARREQLVEPAQPGRPFLDNYRPALLEKGVYQADGQIEQEAFEYGSFVQSKMYAAGVTCTNCHDAHSLQLRAPGNALCGQCHRAEVFNRPEHFHHTAGSSGAQCVNCHMPQKTYMGVHLRHDHSFRIPRPDLSVAAEVSNTCTQCHANKSNRWAGQHIAAWFDSAKPSAAAAETALPPIAALIDAAWQGRELNSSQLAAAAGDQRFSAFLRTGALLELGPYPEAGPTLAASLRDDSPLIRMASLRALSNLAPEDRSVLAAQNLTDPIRAVRIEAARSLAAVPANALSPEQLRQRDEDLQELVTAESASDERPEAHTNLALVYADLGRYSAAETDLKTALRLDPRFVPAMVNLADLYGAQNKLQDAEKLLNDAITVDPANAAPEHLLGLLLVRERNYPAALPYLATAVRLAPNEPRYAYVYAVALHSLGQASQAVEVLEDAHKWTPADREILTALMLYEQERGRPKAALTYADELLRGSPNDSNVKALRQRLLSTK